ncbi:hypothetical protein ACH41E_03325 [Streptomyces sp. NPDC020412]|uniref:hypothetical protein n=1 Tax=Streptomyces sp. NPDC020412 TaxID=3365073 RepID=UPI0037B7E6B7
MLTVTDHVVALDDGRVVESGTAAELLRRGGAFVRLTRQYEHARHWRMAGTGDGLRALRRSGAGRASGPAATVQFGPRRITVPVADRGISAPGRRDCDEKPYGHSTWRCQRLVRVGRS